ncbi:MAG: hypothetical protein KME54_26790 [Tolypothrix brevis GSE-NOS-MK-07-07A]|jgi:transcriptional regulator|nr:hypothetical protein [Tolypothrix brevis GSE-NOS-MK-07-07A]
MVKQTKREEIINFLAQEEQKLSYSAIARKLDTTRAYVNLVKKGMKTATSRCGGSPGF